MNCHFPFARSRSACTAALVALGATAWCLCAQTPASPPAAFVPAPGPAADGPYAPQPILPGGLVVPLYAPDSPHLNREKLREPERYNISAGKPGRIQSIVGIHNPSIEFHAAGSGTGAAVIVVAGGGHRTLNVGGEGGDIVAWLFRYGVNAIILRNRLRSDGYDLQQDAMRDALQAVRLVRSRAAAWKLDPAKIGIMGFSAGAELAAWTAVYYEEFDRAGRASGDPLGNVSARPDFVGLVYPGPTPFTRDPATKISADAPPSFIVCAGPGDKVHAVWAAQYFAAMLQAGVPNLEMHIYGNGVHAGGIQDRDGIPFGKWPERYIEWFRDLGFLGKPQVETKAARDVAAFARKARP